MILIDTSAWIEFFRKAGAHEVKNRVAAYLDIGKAAFCGPIQFELMAGARAAEIDDIQQALNFSILCDFPIACWQHAADIEKILRRKGVTIPRDDIFVASAALYHEIPLYTCDAHFTLIRNHAKIDLKLI